MKKTLVLLSFTAILFSSCKKDDPATLTPTDVTGTSVVKGNVSKNVITPDGFGGWTNSSRIAAAGVNITVKVNKNSLYPNSNAQGADIYSGTTDASGNYAITVKTNANGVSALISIDGFNATQDTIINGVTKVGFYSSYTGTSQNRTLVMGQNFQYDYQFYASAVITNPNNTNVVAGTAIITGSVGMEVAKEYTVGGGGFGYTSTIVKAANKPVFVTFSNDPTTLSPKTYTTTTDANGYYSFTVATVANNTNGFNQNAVISIPDYATTRDTLKVNGNFVTGPAGVYPMETTYQNGVYNGNIRNATNLTYNYFIQN